MLFQTNIYNLLESLSQILDQSSKNLKCDCKILTTMQIRNIIYMFRTLFPHNYDRSVQDKTKYSTLK